MKPKTIMILGQKYTVKVRCENEMPEKKALGMCSSNQNTIYLNTELDGDKKDEVLLHEIIHAISEMIELRLNEVQVNNLAVGLLPFVNRKALKC
jgi:Zn-dependent peptidase ImmA (M78 family)